MRLPIILDFDVIPNTFWAITSPRIHIYNQPSDWPNSLLYLSWIPQNHASYHSTSLHNPQINHRLIAPILYQTLNRSQRRRSPLFSVASSWSARCATSVARPAAAQGCRCCCATRTPLQYPMGGMGHKPRMVPSGYVKIAIENGHL